MEMTPFISSNQSPIAYFSNIIFTSSQGYCLAGPFPGSCSNSILSLHKLLEESHHPTVLYLAVDESAAQRTKGADQSLILGYTRAVLPSWMLIPLFCGIISYTGTSLHLNSPFIPPAVVLYFMIVSLIIGDCGPSNVALGLFVVDFQTHLRGFACPCLLSQMCPQSP